MYTTTQVLHTHMYDVYMYGMYDARACLCMQPVMSMYKYLVWVVRLPLEPKPI